MNEFFVLKTLSDLGSWASIIGFGITFFAFIILYNIKSKFLFRSNVEEHKRNVSEKASEIASLLRDYEKNSHEIDEILALVDVELRAIEVAASDHLLSDVKKSRSLIKKYLSKNWFKAPHETKNEQAVREIKTSLTVVSAQFDHVKRNFLIGN